MVNEREPVFRGLESDGDTGGRLAVHFTPVNTHTHQRHTLVSTRFPQGRPSRGSRCNLAANGNMIPWAACNLDSITSHHADARRPSSLRDPSEVPARHVGTSPVSPACCQVSLFHGSVVIHAVSVFFLSIPGKRGHRGAVGGHQLPPVQSGRPLRFRPVSSLGWNLWIYFQPGQGALCRAGL